MQMPATQEGATQAEGWLIRPQKRLGAIGLVVMLVLANTIIPFSTDMYTPAVPSLPEYFSTTESMVSLTIVGFFLVLTFSVLVFGPVSDRFGRKPVLLAGLGAYTGGSLLCVFAWSIGSLLVFRIVQGTGAGATMAVSMALVKDCFSAHRREQMLAIIQVLGVVGPVAAPLFGGLLLAVFAWQAIFASLAVLGGVCLAMALLFQETLEPEERRVGGVVSTLSGLVDVGRNRSFMMLLCTAAILGAPFMTYITAAPYIYIDFFGETPQVYSYYFAVTAALSSTGPIIWLRASKHVTPRQFTNGVVVLCLIAGALLLAVGSLSAPLFCISFILFALATAAMRPYVTNILLAQQQRDAGSASSLINFLFNVFGVLGMSTVLVPWPSYSFGLATVTTVFSIVAAVMWVILLKSGKFHIAELDC